MKNMFKNPWAKGGEYYPEEALDVSKVLDSSSVLDKTSVKNAKIAGTLEVTSVAGPYKKSKPTEKVKAVSRSHGYYYFATVKNLTASNFQLVKWAVSFDDFDASNSFWLFNGGTITDGKLRVEVRSKKAKDKFKIYAYTGDLPSNSIYTECHFKKSINLFIGGAGDKEPFGIFPKTNNILIGVKNPYEKDMDSTTKLDYNSEYLSYKDAYKNKIETVIIPKLKNKEICSINIIGHSLGGWNGAHLTSKLTAKGYKVGLLVTLDPVGTGGVVSSIADIYWTYPNPSKEYWINILAGSLSAGADLVAASGGRWIPSKPPVDIHKKTEYNHAQSGEMFFSAYAKNTLNPKDFLDVYIDNFLDSE